MWIKESPPKRTGSVQVSQPRALPSKGVESVYGMKQSALPQRSFRKHGGCGRGWLMGKRDEFPKRTPMGVPFPFLHPTLRTLSDL